jgi:predicted cupin superfamily sugar epimerase
MISPEDYIRALSLLPHPEGGWYRETYRSDETIPQAGLPERFPGPRQLATAIYFLLTSDSFSALHRIRSDELWHFYAGSPLILHLIEANGCSRSLRLGPNIGTGESFQLQVPADCWFGATVDQPDSFALVGCTVAPGFNFADFELGRRAALLRQYPLQQELIERLTRD